MAEAVDLPVGYTLAWSGQFEYMDRAAQRLRIVVPATLLIIFLLLYLHFRNAIEPVVGQAASQINPGELLEEHRKIRFGGAR